MELLQIIQTTFSIAIASTRTQCRQGKLIAVDTQRTYPKNLRHEDRFFFLPLRLLHIRLSFDGDLTPFAFLYL